MREFGTDKGDGEVDITEFDITECDVTIFQEIDITEFDVKKGETDIKDSDITIGLWS